MATIKPWAIKRWLQAVWLADRLHQEREVGVHCHFALSASTVAHYLNMLNGNPFTFTMHAKDIYFIG